MAALTRGGEKAPAGRNGKSHGHRRSGERDRIIGARVREARLRKEMSQEGLSELLGVTFQQLQKYEMGANRVAATRLLDIAAALETPVMHFLRDLDSAAEADPPKTCPKGAAALLRSYHAISRPAWRQLAERAVREIAALAAEMERKDQS